MGRRSGFLSNAILAFSSLVFAVFVSLAAAEMIARKLEGPEKLLPNVHEAVLGWLPAPGKTHVRTDEFEVTYDINDRGMNDRPLSSGASPRVRILALGDSHTFGVGVAQAQSWPNQLEAMLFGEDTSRGSVYNAAVYGYSLGQYLLRARGMMDAVNPSLVLVGFSCATDLYDLLPPARGGFVYGEDLGRVYFDLDEKGELIEISDLAGKTTVRKLKGFDKIKRMLEGSALYRRLKRSQLAMAVGMSLGPPGGSLWTGPASALKIHLDTQEKYRWQLAEKIIDRLDEELESRGAKLVVVNIPYLPQVYDAVWNASFGLQPEKYDRWIAGKRLRTLCEAKGIGYVDTTVDLVREARQGRRLHFWKDAHPTAEGHRVIAEVVARFLRERCKELIQR
jgi:lysophospholipase L1-like esterase